MTELKNTRDFIKTKEILRSLFIHIDTVPEMDSIFHTKGVLFKENCKKFYKKWQETQDISSLLSDLKTQPKYPTPKLESMNKMLAYMGLVESLGATLIDIVLMLLVANGREIHMKYPVKHVENFEELNKIRLSNKLDFLKDYKITLFEKFLNRKVRNTIAHLNFKINNDGEIRANNGRIINIDELIKIFWEGANSIKDIFLDIGLIRFFEENQ